MSFVLDPRDQVDGISIYTIAGANITRGELVYITAAGTMALADSSAMATMPAVGIALGTVVTGRSLRILQRGIIVDLNWSWTPGAELYVSTVAGAMTQTIPPGNIQCVAVARSATEIYFNALPPGGGLGAGTGGRGDYTYLIYRYDGNYVVYDDRGFLVHGPGADADTEINWALTTGGAGCVVYLEEDTTFAINDPIAFTANTQVLRGGGRSSFIDGDALATGEHAIVLSGFDDCIIQELSIQTQDGGTKTCHCIFIEDGADRWRIEDVWIVDSDSDGIHIEGTNIIDGWIVNCTILDVDDIGIFSDMDGGNFLSYLQVKNCIFIRVGVDGIHLVDSNYAELIGNIIRDSNSDGISLSNSDDTLINDNEILGTTGYDINIVDATCDRTRIKRNRLTGAGVGCLNDGGTDTTTPFVHEPAPNPDSNVGDHPVMQMLDSVDTVIRFKFYVPLEFQELVTAHVVVIQISTAGPPNMQWSTTTDWGKLCAGENYNTGSDAETDQTTAVTQNHLVCIDMSASLTGIAAGDSVGFAFIRRGTQAGDTINATAYYSEFRMRYV